MADARAYLDWNASAPLRPEARSAMLAALDFCGNPSSVHAEGRAARAIVETSREQVAALVNARPSEVVFTSGASEANATVLAAPCRHVIASRLEHPSIAVPAAQSADFVELRAGSEGIVAAEAIADLVLRTTRIAPELSLVTLQLANGETGVVQPVAELGAFCHGHGIHLHCDATQAAGRMVVDCEALSVSTLALSAHKIGGPKGVGALVIREGCTVPALITGGGQERRRRSGTENVAGIAGFGAAAAAARADLADGASARVEIVRDRIERGLRAITPDLVVIGEGAPRLANTSCVALAGSRSETLVIRLDLAGVAISAGAACSSGKVGRSATLEAMGLSPEVAGSAIRISIGAATSDREIDLLMHAWSAIHATSGVEARPRRMHADLSPEPRPFAVGEH
ncbi:MAG TPA: cysteine desulfurase family protein [Hyphomicrobiaceae bacterium]|nr:cysteine desulfurase family protein [Hyphomicrobiaceae bacterium]